MHNRPSQLYIFGGDEPWQPSDWTSSDDRVRGGSSVSHLTCLPFTPLAKFYGHLDTKTLGGAGFASQRTTGEDRHWDLSQYDGLELDVKKSDGKRYVVILKDSLLPKRPDGREQSTISWEYDFQLQAADKGKKIFVPWKSLRPTYRGREKEDTAPLDLKNIKRISLMMRSFFGTQEGDFSLSITSISGIKNTSNLTPRLEERYRDDSDSSEEQDVPRSMKEEQNNPMRQRGGLFACLCGLLL